MIKINYTTSILIFILLLGSCAAPQHIYDRDSYKRQKELRASRATNVFGEILAGCTSVAIGAMLDTEIEFPDSEQEFKKLNLVNKSADTLYVNMLTDVYWDTLNYCDFMDIRIPPHLNCRVMVPMNAAYNIYFSNKPEEGNDELLEVYSTDVRRLKLYPGITQLSDSIK